MNAFVYCIILLFGCRYVSIPNVRFCGPVTVLGSVVDVATMVMEYMVPPINPLIIELVAPAPTLTEDLSPPSCW